MGSVRERLGTKLADTAQSDGLRHNWARQPPCLARRKRQQFRQLDGAAIGFRRRERRRRAHRRETAKRELLVAHRALHLPRELVVRQLAHYPRRDAGDQRARRNDHRRLHERHRRHHGRLADDGAIVDDRVHADECVALDRAAMEDRAVPDVSVLFHDGFDARIRMQDAAVLHVRPGAHVEPAEVAAQARRGADVAAGADDHVADQDGGRMHVGGRVHDRDRAVDGPHGQRHGISFVMSAQPRPRVAEHPHPWRILAPIGGAATTSAPSETHAPDAASESYSGRRRS